MPFCRECGTANIHSAKQCKQCGIWFQNQTTSFQNHQTSDYQHQSAQTQYVPRKASKVGLVISLSAAGLVFGSIGLCAILGFIGALNDDGKRNISNSNNVAQSTPTQSNSQTSTAKPTETKQPVATPTPFNYERDGLKLVSAKWHKGGFGTVAIWKVTIKNVSDKPLGDIKFRTIYYSETNNVVGKGGVDSVLGKDTIEKIVPPKSSRTFEVNDGFINDEAETANFDLVSWRIID